MPVHLFASGGMWRMQGNFLPYRPEIDGLRAVAVLAVILYHARLEFADARYLTGGYIGVDVFFVISGYLITSILLGRLSTETFSFSAFLNGRVRRILPALLLVLLVSSAVAWLYKLPVNFVDYAESVLSSIFFVSNFYWWAQDVYTAEAGFYRPLLHTWSLSVEEQYYLIFPALLLLVWRYGRRWLALVIGVGLVSSYAFAGTADQWSRDAGFYLLPARFWELLAGGYLAHAELERGRPTGSRAGLAMSAIGLTLVGLSAVLLRDDLQFQAYWMAVPVAGTMMIIWYGGCGDVVSRLLACRPLVAIGLLSYSLYLWHQPVLAFARVRKANILEPEETAALLMLTVALSYLTWRIVEQPFRRRLPAGAVYGTLCASVAAATVFAILVIAKDGVPARFPPFVAALDHLSSTGVRDEGGAPCWNRLHDQPCVLNSASQGVRWVLVGDSMLRAISGEILEKVSARGQRLVEMTQSGCHYAVGMVTKIDGTEIATCSEEINRKRRHYLRSLEPSIVLIHGNLQQQISGEYYDNREGGKMIVDYRQYMTPAGDDLSEPERRSAVQGAVVRSIEELLRLGHKVVLIYPVPEVGWKIPEIIVRNVLARQPVLTTSYAVFRERTAGAYETYDSVADHPNLIRVYPENLLCNTQIKGRCLIHDQQHIYYADSVHLSHIGAEMLVQTIMEKVQQTWGE